MRTTQTCLATEALILRSWNSIFPMPATIACGRTRFMEKILLELDPSVGEVHTLDRMVSGDAP